METERKITQLLAQRAAELRENLQSGHRRDRAALDEWLRDSKLHVEAYLDIAAMDRQLELLDESWRPDIDSILASATANVHELGVGSTSPAGKPGKTKRGPRTWVMAAAAAVLTVIVAVSLFSYFGLSPSQQRYVTAVGERRSVILPDGSRMEMNVDTSIRVGFSQEQRNIELLAGEAVFKVAPDPSRPFTVHTPTVAVRAVGTEFNVYQRQSTVVSVLEGRVQVTTAMLNEPGSAGVEQTSLGAGEEAQVQPGRIERRAHADVSKTLAWREGRLYVDDMALDEIVREFNRNGGPVRVRVEGIASGTFHFGGNFNVTDPVSLADILEKQPELIVERQPGEIVIRPRSASGQSGTERAE